MKRHILRNSLSFTLALALCAALAIPMFPGIALAAGDTEDDPILVTSQADLNAISANLDKHYALSEDITLAGSWTPINNFTGSLDGRGHTIHFDNIGEGLFNKVLAGGKVSNLTLTGCYTKNAANWDLGSLVYNNSGTVANCYSSVVFTNSSTSGDFVIGGLVGRNLGVISGCHFSASSFNYTSASAISMGVGGIAGFNIGANAKIVGCSVSGDISGATVSGSGSNRIGGITGSINQGEISDCAMTGNVYAATDSTSTAAYAGGISGFNDGNGTKSGKIEKSYSSGTATAVGSYSYAGGIAGSAMQYSQTTKCVSAGAGVSATAYVGRIIGSNYGALSSNYANSNMTGSLGGAWGSSPTGIDGMGTLSATLRTQALYTTAPMDWDFNDVWVMNDGHSLPELRRPISAVAITPAAPTVSTGSTQQFSAAVTPAYAPQAVTWEVTGGTDSTISPAGLLSVGAGETVSTLTVKAVSKSDDTKFDTVTVTVNRQSGPINSEQPVPINSEQPGPSGSQPGPSGSQPGPSVSPLPTGGQTITITAKTNNSKYGTVSGTKTVAPGAACTLSARPKAGYRFVAWMENGKQVSKNYRISFKATRERTLTAKFEKGKRAGVTAVPAKGKVTLKLNAAGAAQYQVYRKLAGERTFKLVSANKGTFANKGLKAGGRYYFRVRAVYKAGVTTYGPMREFNVVASAGKTIVLK